jgi:hypothetical protein
MISLIDVYLVSTIICWVYVVTAYIGDRNYPDVPSAIAYALGSSLPVLNTLCATVVIGWLTVRVFIKVFG